MVEEMNQKELMEVNWHRERKVYSQAFERIKEFVQINIIDMKEVRFICQMGGDNFKDASLSSQI